MDPASRTLITMDFIPQENTEERARIWSAVCDIWDNPQNLPRRDANGKAVQGPGIRPAEQIANLFGLSGQAGWEKIVCIGLNRKMAYEAFWCLYAHMVLYPRDARRKRVRRASVSAKKGIPWSSHRRAVSSIRKQVRRSVLHVGKSDREGCIRLTLSCYHASDVPRGDAIPKYRHCHKCDVSR